MLTYDSINLELPETSSVKMGVVQQVSNGKAKVQIGSTGKILNSDVICPTQKTILPGERVLILFADGAWWILNNY